MRTKIAWDRLCLSCTGEWNEIWGKIGSSLPFFETNSLVLWVNLINFYAAFQSVEKTFFCYLLIFSVKSMFLIHNFTNFVVFPDFFSKNALCKNKKFSLTEKYSVKSRFQDFFSFSLFFFNVKYLCLSTWDLFTPLRNSRKIFIKSWIITNFIFLAEIPPVFIAQLVKRLTLDRKVQRLVDFLRARGSKFFFLFSAEICL